MWLLVQGTIAVALRKDALPDYGEYHRIGSRIRRIWILLAVMAVVASVMNFNSYISFSEKEITVKQPWRLHETFYNWDSARFVEWLPGNWMMKFSDGSIIRLPDFDGKYGTKAVVEYAHEQIGKAQLKRL